MRKRFFYYVAVFASYTLLLYAADTTPPTIPTHLTATALGPTKIALTWEKSSDTDGYVNGYKIYRNGLFWFFVEKGRPYYVFENGAERQYSVSAVDKAGNESGRSPEVTIKGLNAIRPHTTVYVDNTLSKNITDGTYSVSNRSGGGSDGNAYRTIQAGIAAINPGDHVLIRNGTYYECDIDIPKKNNGRSFEVGEYSLLASYPGEWAKIDGQYQFDPISYYGGSIISSSGKPNNCAKFWRFERLEVTGAGRNPKLQAYDGAVKGYGFDFEPANDIEIRYCYVHNNHGGDGPNGGCGIACRNSGGGGAKNLKILYCVVSDNGWPGVSNQNLENINIYGDYNYIPESVNLENATQKNEIAYNLVKGSTIGIKMKSVQRLVQDHVGDLPTSMAAKDKGDRIHHNIISEFNSIGILYRQDFQQIYNNIFDINGNNITGIKNIGSEESMRESFYMTVYNNTTIIRTNSKSNAFIFEHGYFYEQKNYDEVEEGYHPYLWCLNNLIVREGTTTLLDMLNTGEGASVLPINTYRWDTIHFGGLYFVHSNDSSPSIRAGNYYRGPCFTAQEFEAAGYGQKMYQQSVDPAEIFVSSDDYVTNPSHYVDSGETTIANGGVGGEHPFLEGIKIPSYIGATMPGDSTWVDGVKNLALLDINNVPINLRDAINGSTPDWVEGRVEFDSPSITLQPSDTSAYTGNYGYFSVIAYGGNLQYQWKKNGVDIIGATKASYRTPLLSLDDNNSKFSCVISNSSSSVTSDTATLSVTNPPDDFPPSVPAHLTATALGSTRISLTWEKSIDAEGFVSSYNVYRNGSLVKSVEYPYLIFSGINGAQQYSVSAIDNKGQEGARSVPVTITASAEPRSQTTVYVDNNLEQNIINGTYSISNRAGGGSDGNAYRTIQAGIAAINPGDHVLIRNGTYYECDINIPKENSGTSWNEGEYTLVASYPGEWAKVHGRYQFDPISYYGGSIISSSGSGARFWRFERLEVTGAGKNPELQAYDGNAKGYGFDLAPANDIEIRYCYIHDNHGGRGPNGGCGISCENAGGGGARNIKILYSVVTDNGWPGITNLNLQNINIYGDYQYNPESVDLETATQKNEIAYNLIKGSSVGIKMKSVQRLVKDNAGDLSTSMNAKDKGDIIHHNIISEFNGIGILYRQDFQQIYNNILEIKGNNISGIKNIGADESLRESFYMTVYNNTAIIRPNSHSNAFVFEHGNFVASRNYDETVEGYHPYLWNLNNLIYRMDSSPNEDLCLNTSWRPQLPLQTYRWDTIHIGGIYFASRNPEDISVRMGHYSAGFTYSAQQFELSGFGQNMYQHFANPSDLFTDENYYITNPNHLLGRGETTIANGGIGGPHPYLDGTTIPSYVGATKPGDSLWAQKVNELGMLVNGIPVNLRDAVNGSTPSWVEGAASQNYPPEISPISNISKYEGELIQFDVNVTDQDEGDSITLSSFGLPVGAVLNKIADRTWQFTWQTDFATAGTYTVILNAHDGYADSQHININIIIDDVNTNINVTNQPEWCTI